MNNSRIAIIGGTGLYDVGEDVVVIPHSIETPYGLPSDRILEVCNSDASFLFLSRHGKGHRLLPSEINYRANIWALKSLGAAWCVSVSAVGSLRDHLIPGDVVIPNQMIDKTTNRIDTFFGDGVVAHVSMAEPFCSVLRLAALKAARAVGSDFNFMVHDGGTYLCMDGPAFSTRAEAKMHRAWGADIIGMTNLPEAKLAREAELAYTTIAMVTDFDCWKENGEDVHAHGVAEMVRTNSQHARTILKNLLPQLRELEVSEVARDALRHSIFTDLTTVPELRRKELEPILGRYYGN